MGFVILLLFPKVLGEMAEYGGGIARPSLKCGDATRTAPAVAPFHADNDVFIEEAAVLEKSDCGLRREFVGSEFANADQISQFFGFFRFR